MARHTCKFSGYARFAVPETTNRDSQLVGVHATFTYTQAAYRCSWDAHYAHHNTGTPKAPEGAADVPERDVVHWHTIQWWPGSTVVRVCEHHECLDNILLPQRNPSTPCKLRVHMRRQLGDHRLQPRAAVIETRRHDGASNYAHTGATRAGICTDHHRRSVLPRQHAVFRPGQPLRAGPIVRAPAPTAASTPGVRWRALRSHRQWGGQTRRTRQRMSKGWGPGCLHQRVLIGNVAGGRPIKRQGRGVAAVARHWQFCRRGVLDEHTAWSELLFPLR